MVTWQRCVQVSAVEQSGEMNVGLCYNDHTQRLIVSVVETRNLRAASLDIYSPGHPLSVVRNSTWHNAM